MSRSLRFEVFYPFGRELVWRAISDPEWMQDWLQKGTKTDFEPVLGKHFTFRSAPQPGWDGVTYCEVVELEPTRRLAYTWKGKKDEKPTLVVWTLESRSSGTHLVLEHRDFEGIRGFFESLLLGLGWRGIKRALRRSLENRVGRAAA
jgi:uncharacterized protein YndB with AHSA1/START domain